MVKKAAEKAGVAPIGDTISPVTAFTQAANALDLAAELAAETKDTETLITVAAHYMEIGSRLMVEVEGEEEDEEDFTKQPLGFVPTIVPIKREETEEDE